MTQSKGASGVAEPNHHVVERLAIDARFEQDAEATRIAPRPIL